MFRDFFELPVILPLFIISQIFGLINIGLTIYKYQVKDKAKTLRMSAVGNVFKALNYAFLLNWSIAALKVVSIAKNLTFAKTSKPGAKIKLKYSVALLILFSSLSVAAVFVAFLFNRIWFEWVVLGAVLLSNFGKWKKGIHLLRITAVVYRAVMIINSIFFFLNITNLIKGIIVIGTIIVFYIRFFRARKKQRCLAGELADGEDGIESAGQEADCILPQAALLEAWEVEPDNPNDLSSGSPAKNAEAGGVFEAPAKPET